MRFIRLSDWVRFEHYQARLEVAILEVFLHSYGLVMQWCRNKSNTFIIRHSQEYEESGEMHWKGKSSHASLNCLRPSYKLLHVEGFPQFMM